MNPVGNGYQKLISSYKELDEINTKMVDFVTEEFPENSTLITWGAVTYGSYVPGRSDFDFIIVLKESLTIETIREKIGKCHEYCGSTGHELDIIVMDLATLKRADYRGISLGDIKRLDDMDHYIISHFGKVLYGDQEVLTLFPKREIKEFYRGIVNGFRRAIEKKVLNQFMDGEDSKAFVERHIVLLMLMYRVLFTYLNNEVWGKIESINWAVERLGNEAASLKKLGEIIKEIYLKNGEYNIDGMDFKSLINQAVQEFLALTEKKETNS